MPREDVRSALKKLDYTRLCFVHERFRVWYYNFYFSPLSFSRSVFETVNLSVMTELHSSLIQWVCVRLSEPLSQWIFLAWERFVPLSISRWVFEPVNHLNQWMFLSVAPLSFSGLVCESVNLPTPLKLIWPKLELSTVEISKLDWVGVGGGTSKWCNDQPEWIIMNHLPGWSQMIQITKKD